MTKIILKQTNSSKKNELHSLLYTNLTLNRTDRFSYSKLMKANYSIVISLDHFLGFKQDLSSYRYNIRARKILVKNGPSPNGMIDVTKRSEEKR